MGPGNGACEIIMALTTYSEYSKDQIIPITPQISSNQFSLYTLRANDKKNIKKLIKRERDLFEDVFEVFQLTKFGLAIMGTRAVLESMLLRKFKKYSISESKMVNGKKKFKSIMERFDELAVKLKLQKTTLSHFNNIISYGNKSLHDISKKMDEKEGIHVVLGFLTGLEDKNLK